MPSLFYGNKLISGGGTTAESKIDGVKINGVQQPIDEDKNINIDIPTKTSDLINDSNLIDNTKVATKDELGLVKVDNSTIVIQDGTISANINNLLDDTQANNDKTYSSNKIENDFTKQSDVLTLNNTVIYTPTNDYHPVTKKYVDDAISAINGMKLIDRVNTVSDLPSDANEGDVYYVGLETDTVFDTYVKLNNGNWLKIGSSTIDMNNYYNKDEINSLLKSKISICNTLPTASIDYNEQCYFNIFDRCIYQCILDNSDYKWNKIVSNESPIYKSNVEPTDKTKLWLDTSDSTKILIKTYDETNSAWITLNDIPIEFIKNATYVNNKLTLIFQDDTTLEIPLGSGTGVSSWDNLIAKPFSTLDEYKFSVDVNTRELSIKDIYLDKDTYASTVNEGYVKFADVAENLHGLENNSDPNVYYGHNSVGETGIYPLPIGLPDESKIQKYEFLNITPSWEKDIESLYDLNDKVIISVKKLVSESTDIDITISNFNTENEILINHTENVLIENDGISIKKEYKEIPVLNGDGFYEIDLSSYSIINECEVN